MNSRPLVFFLPVAAVAILATVAYKQTLSYPNPESFVVPGERRPAPSFEAYDAFNKLVKFQRYLGRHEILLAFYRADETVGADTNATLLELEKQYDKLESQGVIVVGISSAIPQWNRKAFQRRGKLLAEQARTTPSSNETEASLVAYEAAGRFSFPLVTDVTLDIHKVWGRYEESTKEPLEGVFYIDRAGQVAWKERHPVPLESPSRLIERLTEP